MIDPIGPVFGQHPEDRPVEWAGRCEVVPERLFDNDAPPRLLRLLDRRDVAELLDGIVVLLPLGHQPLEMFGGLGLNKVCAM
jgi:hypothetical protein